MDDSQSKNNLFEFLKLLQKGELEEIKGILKIIRNLSSIIEKTLSPSLVLINFYEQESQMLKPFSISGVEVKKEDLEFEMDVFESDNPYSDLFTSSNPVWVQIDSISDSFVLKETLTNIGIKEAIIVPLIYNDTTIIGTLTTFMFPDTEKCNEKNYFEIVTDISHTISSLISSWAEKYSSFLKQQQTELIVEMSNLTLETTELEIILNNILPKITKRTHIKNIGVFIKDINQFTLMQHIGMNEDIINYFSRTNFEVSNLPYYNTSNKIEDADISIFSEQYGIILPIGSTNIILGFLLVISPTQENLSESNIHFLRIVANQLFLTLQRKRLLDDIQQITQTSEYSSFPLLLVNNKYEILYLNKQAEKTFNLSHHESLGAKLDYSLKLQEEKSVQVREKINDVISNIAKGTMKLDIEVSQLGKSDTRTFFVQLSPTINNLTGEYCVSLSLVDISEATKLQSIAEEYSNRSRMYLNVLTHDIYNILFGISGYYELLDDKENQIIQRVSTLVKRGTAIVQDIRLLSSVLDISTSAERMFVPLKMTIERVIVKIKEEYYDKEIKITNDIPPEIRVIAGVFLYEMFLYTFTSLLQKTTSSDVSIEISGEQISIEDESYFELKIIDKEGTRPEIREEIQRALSLSPFDENVRKHLGFMIVNEIAKKYNYTVKMKEVDEKDWKKGSVFEIIMPRIIETEMDEENKEFTI
ncbi:MAG: HAMP domain-containing histidine kinase [Candidatus Heimdallarchaeota archaeon]|nr:HAMP domain-containing histidine kinase [Candidatus Heimdallarchaeota archaeon]